MSHSTFLTRLVLFFILLSFSSHSLSANILAVVSPRNTADVLSGAHQFLNANKGHQITLRTTDQFNSLDDAGRDKLIKSAELVFIGGVYGDSVSLFKNYLSPESKISPNSFVAVHSDRSLVLSSHIANRALLKNANLDGMMKDPPADTDVRVWSEKQLSQFPKQQDWLLSKTFWADRNTDNIE